MTILTNDLLKGQEVLLTGDRIAKIVRNQKGTIKDIEVLAINGFYNEFGTCYVDEIRAVKTDNDWKKVSVDPKHQKICDQAHAFLGD